MLIEKIKAELKKQGLPESMAKFINVTSEAEIEAAVSELKGFVPTTLEDVLKNDTLKGQYQSALDRRVTEAVKTNEQTLKTKFDFVEKGGNPDPNKKQEPSAIEKQIAALADAFTKQNEAFTGFMQKTTLEKRKVEIAEKLKAKLIPETWADRVLNVEDDKLEEAIKGLETEYIGIKQKWVDDQVRAGGKIVKSSGESQTDLTDKVKEVLGLNKDGEKPKFSVQQI